MTIPARFVLQAVASAAHKAVPNFRLAAQSTTLTRSERL